MIIRFALWMFLLSLPLFLLAFTVKIAIYLLLGAFGLLIFSGLIGLAKHIFVFFQSYFSIPERENRRALFVLNQKNNRERLFYFQRLQILYFKEWQQRKILEKNNRDQINALSDSIERELFNIKNKLSKELFLQLRHENRRYRKQQNEQALLELHAKLATFADK